MARTSPVVATIIDPRRKGVFPDAAVESIRAGNRALTHGGNRLPGWFVTMGGGESFDSGWRGHPGPGSRGLRRRFVRDDRIAIAIAIAEPDAASDAAADAFAQPDGFAGAVTNCRA
jgi:hypothetical protein